MPACLEKPLLTNHPTLSNFKIIVKKQVEEKGKKSCECVKFYFKLDWNDTNLYYAINDDSKIINSKIQIQIKQNILSEAF